LRHVGERDHLTGSAQTAVCWQSTSPRVRCSWRRNQQQKHLVETCMNVVFSQ
jgi:hypothetical protein